MSVTKVNEQYGWSHHISKSHTNVLMLALCAEEDGLM